MIKPIYGPYKVTFAGPGVFATIGELPSELEGKSVLLKVVEEDMSNAAVRTLTALGYTYHGAECWKPPIKLTETNYVTR